MKRVVLALMLSVPALSMAQGISPSAEALLATMDSIQTASRDSAMVAASRVANEGLLERFHALKSNSTVLSPSDSALVRLMGVMAYWALLELNPQPLAELGVVGP